MSEEDRWVVGIPWQPEGEQDEDGNPIWACEVQTIGGHAVQAVVYGGTADLARELAGQFAASSVLLEAVRRARRHAMNLGIDSGSYVEQLDAAIALATPDA